MVRKAAHVRVLRLRSWGFVIVLLGLFWVLAGNPQKVVAGSGDCPAGLPEGPVIKTHLSQEDIAGEKISFQEILNSGELLFEAKFNICDGQGRPATTGGGDKREPDEPAFSRISAPDSNACAGCHNEPRSGGGGDIVANVFVLAQTLDPVTHSDESEFSNFRNTLGMFGSGPIEMLAREMTTDLLALRDTGVKEAASIGTDVVISLDTKGVHFGELTAHPDGTFDTTKLEGIDPDLIVKPFHAAGRVISLREFTNNAMNHHHGMQSEERFDLNPSKGMDFDEDGIVSELTIGDITAVAIWQASLGVPGQVLPDAKADQQIIANGEARFAEIGCATCHVPELKLNSSMFVEPNPYNPPGNWSDANMSYSFDMTTTGEGPYLEKDGDGAVVRAYTDLKRHTLCDEEIHHYCNELLTQGRADQNGESGAHFFLTRKLWDVGNSAPYGHVGDLTTISEAILAHGGEGRESRDAFAALPAADQEAVIHFLKSLQILPAGSERVVTESELNKTENTSSSSLPSLSYIWIGALAVFIGLALGFTFGRSRNGLAQ